jgi:HK97 family phage major capsid protein
MASNAHSGDEMIRRHETELNEKDTLVRGIFERANASNRDLNEEESQMVAECRGRMETIKSQMEQVEDVNRIAFETRNRAREIDGAINKFKGSPQLGEVEYRSAGSYMIDMWNSAQGNRDATERLDVFTRQADHQKTGDSLGVIPDPIVGPVINFIDAARPLVSALGPMAMTSSTFYRPFVSQQPAVGLQGTDGGPTQEKVELDSQKMIITRKTVTAKTYGGYVNVSRQTIDFSNPSALDLVVNGLAQQYAITTEAALGDALDATSTAAIGYGATPTDATVAAAVWEAVGTIYGVTKGQGRVIIAVAPDVLGVFGPLFSPVNPQNAQSPGFTAAGFNQGLMGTVGGVPVYMSAGLGAGEAFAFSTAAIECFEQRVGTLQVVEPSVFGLQVAYAGYFSTLTVDDDAIIPLTAS